MNDDDALRERQLSLFKGRRQRGRALPPPREIETHIALTEVIQRWAMPGWVWTHFPAGEARPQNTASNGRRFSMVGAKLKRMGLNAGFPDYQFFCIDGRCAFLELKRIGGSLSEAQEIIAGHLIKAGHSYLCTSSFADAVTFLQEHGIVRATVRV